MTPEDLDQIRALMREETATLRTGFQRALERTMAALTVNLSDAQRRNH